MKSIPFFMVTFVVLFISAWVINGYKLSQCDFESDYKCEFVHAVGLIPALYPITVWFDVD